jgi:hypothetical protein
VTKVSDFRLVLQNMMTVSKKMFNNFALRFLLSERKIVLRGCSSKRKMFHIECESHLSGTRNEQFVTVVMIFVMRLQVLGGTKLSWCG